VKPQSTIPPLPEGFFLAAAKVSASFETTRRDPYVDVTPDFDGQGLTLGMFGWNIRQGSLQPLVAAAGWETVHTSMGRYASDFWKACDPKNVSGGLNIVHSWQVNWGTDNVKFRPEHAGVVKELQAFLGTQTMREVQRRNVRERSNKAWRLATAWARRDHPNSPVPTVREHAVFLDTIVQNGSFAGLTYDDTVKWYAEHPGELPSHAVCDYLSRVTDPQWQPVSAQADAELWKDHFPARYERLLLLSFMRAKISNGSGGRAKANVLCRRGTILANQGVVNGLRWTFPELEEPVADATPTSSDANSKTSKPEQSPRPSKSPAPKSPKTSKAR
jgi:hypothetical protein